MPAPDDLSIFATLYETAHAARVCAYAPYSGFTVGAALLSGSGTVFAGCNIENAAYPLGLCAEAAALAALISAGEREVRAVLVLAGAASAPQLLCTPCGGCRQRLAEFAAPETPIHVCGPEGLRQRFTLSELLPHGFSAATLARPA